MTVQARRAELRGVVQGVGFRPFVARLARRLGLHGFVANRGGAVVVEVEGPPAALDAFTSALLSKAPAAARIEECVWTPAPVRGSTRFVIEPSEATTDGTVAISPDLRVCPTCLAELTNDDDLRFGYAFNGCSDCGPRFCIATASPWQRDRSSMAKFTPCPACAREWLDPEDRRFHAEAIACPTCGPQLRLEDGLGRVLSGSGEEAIMAAATLLRGGGIVGLQGVGGFQLLVDASDSAAVLRLRERKHRPAKPLAVMVATLAEADALAWLDEAERAALAGSAGPIVLVRRRPGTIIAEPVAHARPYLGLMLATTPVHAQLLAQFGGPLVATSGNVHGRPIARTQAEARAQLASVVDTLLVHDRPIQRRCDDSVAQVVDGELRVLRLGRGFAPASFALPRTLGSLPPMLGLGAQLGQTPVLLAGSRATAWPQVGDLDDPDTRAAMHEAIADLEAMLGAHAPLLAIDTHPDYASTQWARAQHGRRCVPVFHHHAHVAAVLAEHGRTSALGVAWDGTGLGPDHTSWGGEFLAVDERGARRVASLRPFPLPGANAAARDGLRPLAGLLAAADLDHATDPRLARLLALARRSRLAPRTSSVGRLFDAVAALTGVCTRSRYQGEAAQALEYAASPGAVPYPFHMDDGVLDWQPMLEAMIAEHARSRAPELVASRFHATLIAMIVTVAEAERAPTVVLAGGCFANRLLLEGAAAALRERGIEALAARRLPPGDGGLALGQVWVAGHQLALGGA